MRGFSHLTESAEALGQGAYYVALAAGRGILRLVEVATGSNGAATRNSGNRGPRLGDL